MTELELLTRDYLKHLFPNEEVKYNERPPWLLVFNDIWKKKTRRELDIWYPRLRFAVEVNGATHFDPDVAKADRKKHGACGARGIRLLDVWSPEDFFSLRTLLSRHNPNEAPIPEDLRARIATYLERIEHSNGSERVHWMYVARQNRKHAQRKVELVRAAKKRKAHWDKIYEIHRRERESNLRRMQRRATLNT